MFEISSERGKSEKMIDLLHDGGDVSMQHSVIKGLEEVISGRIFYYPQYLDFIDQLVLFSQNE